MPTTPILLAEDEPSSVFFFERLAKKLNIPNPIHVARDGREALDYLQGMGEFADRQRHPLPGLVILDLKMPWMTGLEVLRQIRADPGLRTLIVVMMTSSASDADIRTAYELGANAFL
jgi:CheY-like chemotaxis protein